VAAGDQVTMPFEDGVRAYQQPQAAQTRTRQSVKQPGQQRPVGRLEPGPLAAELPWQHRDLVAQCEDLGVLVPIAARQ
jgi:hypothetical protein